MDAYCEESSRKALQSMPEQIRMTWERVERMQQRVDDTHERQVTLTGMFHEMDARMIR
jgi:delta-aminolevulinic acid dehydratase/porphobilinogen synthase